MKKFKVMVATFLTSLVVASCSAKAYADGPCDVNLADVDMIAQLVQAEAGNQDLYGMRLVVDVVLNRVDSPAFPNSVAEVIYQKGQFTVIRNGMFDAQAGRVSEAAYLATYMEMERRENYGIVFFSRRPSKWARNHFKYQDHWFGY